MRRPAASRNTLGLIGPWLVLGASTVLPPVVAVEIVVRPILEGHPWWVPTIFTLSGLAFSLAVLPWTPAVAIAVLQLRGCRGRMLYVFAMLPAAGTLLGLLTTPK